ncbi:AsmA family protein [Aerophototrophica crusticola]|uniref:AsmA family protein n=1 Tax=Aerophototrophica crusticola TaxID=1709002 RepID=A0A858R8N5_9PROT|nr:AsmA family protein [Rhodospirillaceae bacterium B3]
MRKLLVGLGVVVVLLVAALVAIPFLVPKEALVARLEREVEARTGRELSIKGPVDVSVLPNIAVTLRDVTFAGLPGGPDLLNLGSMDVRLQLWPLLSGEAKVDRFVLDRPTINLVVDKQGRANWQIQPQQPAPADPNQPAGGPVSELSLGDVEIRDGTLTYADARTGSSHKAEDLDLELSMARLDAPLELTADMRVDGKPLSVRTQANPARALVEGGTAKLVTTLSTEGAEASLDGQLTRPAGGEVSVAGDLQAAVASLPATLKALTGQAPANLPVSKLDLTGKLQATPQRVALSGMDLKADEIAVTGDLAASLGGVRPAVKGALAVSRLDLDRLMPPATPAAAPAQPAPAGAPVSAQATGWSREPIDLSGLKAADLDLDVKLAGLLVAGVEAGATTLGLDLKDGKLNTALAPMQLFGGSVQGKLGLDAAAATPGVAVQATLKGIQAEPVLRRFANFERLSGTTEATLDMKGQGRSQHDLMGSLDGQGQVIFRDGAVKGINVAALVRSVTGGATDGPQQTDFAEMGGAFTVQDGVAKTEDFRLIAPLLRVAGSGTVQLQPRTVDFRIVPRLVASIEGQGAGSTDQKGLSVPILVTGSFDALSFKPDLSGVVQEAIRDPAALRDKAKELRDLPGALLGGGGQPAPDGTQPQSAPKPEEAVRGVLEGLLGGQKPPAGSGR